MRFIPCFSAPALLALAGCASVAPATAPERAPDVALINSLSFDNAMTGKRDGLRSAWPAATLTGASEQFALVQLKQCDQQGAACKWGVLKAQRSFGKVSLTPAGVAVDLAVNLDVGRSAHAKFADQDAALTIPSDVPALQAKRVETRALVLEYGKVTRIDFDFGIRYELCAQRQEADGKPRDKCDIASY